MKETIEYYYNLEIDTLEELDNKYHFKIDSNDYFFVYYNRTLEELDSIVSICNELGRVGINGCKICININNSILTKVSDFDYILFVCNDTFLEYDIFDMLSVMDRVSINSSNTLIYRNNWGILWSSKIDYLESQVGKIAIDKEVIRSTFSYYIGLAEMATCYVISTDARLGKVTSKRLVLSHRRVYYPNYKLNYLNPLSFIFDIEVRDIAELVKSMFFKCSMDEVLDELDSYLSYRHLSEYDAEMLMGRIIYPSYYFDLYEGVVEKGVCEDKLLNVIKRVDEYEEFLKKVYLLINKYTPITKIEFLTD